MINTVSAQNVAQDSGGSMRSLLVGEEEDGRKRQGKYFTHEKMGKKRCLCTR